MCGLAAVAPDAKDIQRMQAMIIKHTRAMAHSFAHVQHESTRHMHQCCQVPTAAEQLLKEAFIGDFAFSWQRSRSYRRRCWNRQEMLPRRCRSPPPHSGVNWYPIAPRRLLSAVGSVTGPLTPFVSFARMRPNGMRRKHHRPFQGRSIVTCMV